MHECCCGRFFSQTNAFSNHQKSCKKAKTHLSSALESAKENWVRLKKARLTAAVSSSSSASSASLPALFAEPSRPAPTSLPGTVPPTLPSNETLWLQTPEAPNDVKTPTPSPSPPIPEPLLTCSSMATDNVDSTVMSSSEPLFPTILADEEVRFKIVCVLQFSYN